MVNDPRGLFLITARKGSKGFKNKNIQKIKGKSLIQWSIECAKKTQFNWPICLSTDSKEWHDQFLNYSFFLRPKKLSTDNTSSIKVIQHALNFFKKKGKNFDFICLLEPPGVMRKPEDIINSYKLFCKYNFEDTVVTISEVGDSHPYRMKYFDKKNNILKNFLNYPDQGLPRQKQSKLYLRNSFVYIFPVSTIIQNKLYTKNTRGLLVNRLGCDINIDKKEDYILAKSILESRV